MSGRVGTAAPGVLLDANPYRSMKEDRFAALVELERHRGVARYAEPFAVMELLAHLADPQDPAFASCRRAIGRVFRRCGPAGGDPCGIIRDSESRLHELITGKGLEGNDARTETMGVLISRIATTPFDQPLLEEENSRLRVVAAHVAETEASFADTGRRLQQTIKAVLDSEEDPAERERIWKSVMATNASDVQRKAIAEVLLRAWCREAGLPLPEPPLGPADRLQHRTDNRPAPAVARDGRFGVRTSGGGHGLRRPRAHARGVRAVASRRLAAR